MKSDAKVILISGPEPTLRERKLKEILTDFETGPDDFDFESMMADVRGPADWVGAASTTPFLGDKRTILVRHLLRSGHPDDHEAHHLNSLSDLPETGRMILMIDQESGDDSKQKTLDNHAKAWERFVKKINGLVISELFDLKKIEELVVAEAKSHGKTISRSAANSIVERTAQSLTLALEETAKAAIYVGDKDTIREEDVEASVMTTRDWNVFKMIDAAIAGRLGEAQRHLQILVASSNKPEDSAFRNIFPNLHTQLRLLWQARLFIEARVDPASPTGELQAMLPDKPNFCKEQDWKRKKNMALARSITLPQIGLCLRELADADARLKGQLPSIQARDTLEFMLQRVSMHLAKSVRN